MGSISWRTTRSLDESIRQHPEHFNFYQLINLLINYRGYDDVGSRDASCFENFDSTQQIDSVLRLKSKIRFDFPPSEFSKFNESDDHDKTTLLVNKFGIAGIYGPLPQAYSEWLYREIYEGKQELADFLDIFNHRLLSLRYQVRSRTRVSLAAKSPNNSLIGVGINSVMGFGNELLLDRMLVSPRLLQTYAGLLANCRTGVQVIKGLLGSVLGTTVTIEQLQGCWREIEVPDRSYTGVSGNHNLLGQDTTLGRRGWDQQGMITVSLGPFSYQRLCDLMPKAVVHVPPEDSRSKPGCNGPEPDSVESNLQDHERSAAETASGADNVPPGQETAGEGDQNPEEILSSIRDHDRLVELIRFLSNGRWDCRLRLTIRRKDIPCSLLRSAARSEDASAGSAIRRRNHMALGQTAWLKSGCGRDGETGFMVRMH